MNAIDSSLTDHANALAYVTKAVADLEEAHAIIGQLRADLHHEQDRVEMVTEDRDFYRNQANSFRALLIELATRQDTINRESETAQAIVATINEAIKPPRAETHALAALQEEFNKGNEAA